MLTLVIGTDWIANRDHILNLLSKDVSEQRGNRILLVPELISHDMERRLCAIAGNTSSRFAEVVSFSRLTRRICDWAGCGLQPCLDNGGRLVAMAAAARQLHSKLKAYASVETKPEFLSGLVDAVDEFKRCCITSEDLSAAATRAEGAFAQKLEELSLLLEAYDAMCQQGKRDPRDQLSWGLEQLQNCDFAEQHVFYIDGFPDFTIQNMSVISHLIVNSPHVIISINCDKPGSKHLAFSKAGDTASKILRIAKQAGIVADIQLIQPRQNRISPIREKIFHGRIEPIHNADSCFRTIQAENVHEECILAAERVMELVQNGARYRDIALTCTDLQTYENALIMQFQKCGIPLYIAGTDEILNKSVIATVLTALEAAMSGFDTKDILRYLKSALSPLSLDACDKLENYVLLWNVNGKNWLDPWTMHPDGLQENWSKDNLNLLEFINQCRKQAVDPLHKLRSRFLHAKDVSGQVNALYAFLDDIQLQQRLSELAVELDSTGDNRSAQIMNQLWEILLSALEQLNDILGHTNWDNDSFVRLLKLLLSQYDVGTIPPVLDSVMIGSVSSMRCQEAKHVIIIGASEGKFPSYGSAAGVLSDHERNTLRKMGIPLTGGAAEGLEIEFSEIYGVFCAATKTVQVSCPTGQTSFVFRRLVEMAGGEYHPQDVLGSAASNRNDAASYLCRRGDVKAAADLGIEEIYQITNLKSSHNLGQVSENSIRELYGNILNLSASQVEKQADCKLAYFLKYGLRAKEQKPVTVDPAEFGTYVHYVLEHTARQICELGGFRAVTLEQTMEIARRFSDEYTDTHFSQIDSQRISYLFRRNDRELMMVVEELWDEFQHSSFTPVDFEVSFGDQSDLSAIPIQGKRMLAKLRGFVDRVDAWQEDGRNYFRVVDYKTGKKDFDYCDVFNGLSLQMLLYLFALEQDGEALLGKNPIPAGVQYFPARVPILSADGELSDEDARTERQRLWKRSGLILSDDDVLTAMDDSQDAIRLSCRRKKDGTITGDIATRDQFRLLNEYVFQLLGNMVDDISSGDITPNPYTRGNSHNACRFCPYGAVCHVATVENRRNYKTMSSQRFWDEIGKEVGKHA